MLMFYKAVMNDPDNPTSKMTCNGITYGDTILDAVARVLEYQFGEDQENIISLTVYPESEVVDDFDYENLSILIEELEKANT